MPVLLSEEKPPKRSGPSKCQIFCVIFVILVVCSVGVYILYTKYLKKVTCNTEECLKSSVNILATIDTSVNPCEDFRQFTCGKYLKRSSALGAESQFSYPEFLWESQINLLITDTNDESGWKLLDAQRYFYQSCRDTSEIDEDNNQSLLRLLNETGGWPILQGAWNSTNFDLTNFLSLCYELGIPFERFFKISYNADLNLLQLVTPFDLEQDDDDTKELVYHNLIVETVTHLGGLKYTAEIEAEKMIDLEKSLKQIWATYDSARDETFSSDEILRRFPKINIPLLFENVIGESMMFSDDNITATNVDVISDINLLLAGTPPRTLVNYIIWKFIEDQGALLANPLREKFQVHFGFPTNKNSGHEPSRRDICLDEAKKRFPRVAEMAWIESALEKNVTQMSSLFNNIKEALISRIQGLEFLSKETKNDATDKLKILKEITVTLYDDVLPNLLRTGEVFNATSNVFDMSREQNINNFNLKLKLINESRLVIDNYLQKKLTREIYFTDEAVVLPPLYLQEYFYTSTRPNYLNFATFGVVISKQFVKRLIEILDETTHIFEDILGNSFTWSNQDLLNLFVRARCAAENYIDADIGVLTPEIFSENTEDLMSVDIAYEAYQNFMKKQKPDPLLPLLPFSPNQLFWIDFAQQYCSENLVEHNGVTLEYRQLNIIKNSRYFARDFGCAVGTEMHPERKCTII